MTTLDQRLYAWLLESDDRRFELAFKVYFDVAYPSLVRHLARLSRWDPVELEELAQDALLRFFEKVGRNRREASELVGVTLEQLRTPNFGAFHERQASSWIKNVESFRQSAVTFRVPQPEDSEWKADIRTLAERIPVLQRVGCHLLHSVHLELRWTFDGIDPDPSAPTDPQTDQMDNQLDGAARGNHVGDPASMNCEQRLVDEMHTQSARAAAAERDHPGTAPFVQGTWTVVGALPLLRVPTNGYLFEIAGTIYLDECKKRGRRKRGGMGALSNNNAGEGGDPCGESSNHPIERFALESFAEDDGEEQFDHPAPAKVGNTVMGSHMPSVDSTSQYESEDLFEKFYEYLRRPVDDAVQSFHQAQQRGRAIAERRKLDSLMDKFSRTMSVLSLMGEGHTQEQTAERLGLSRNQVKYIIETVQDAYARFTTETSRPTMQHTAGKPHVAS